MTYQPVIPQSEPERSAFLDGARAEAKVQVRGMSDSGRDLYEFVQTVAQQGRSADEIVRSTTYVYTAGWSLRRRASLAWKVLRNG